MEHLKEQFFCAKNFQQAWAEVAENQGCAGVDGETIAHFAQQSDRYLAQLQQAVREGRYRPMPLRQLFIPKRMGGWRELGVPSVRDRICEKVAHPDVQEPVSYRRVIQLQVKRCVRALLGNEPYEPFRRVI